MQCKSCGRGNCNAITPGLGPEGGGDILIVLDRIFSAADSNGTFYAGPEGNLLAGLLDAVGLKSSEVTVASLGSCYGSSPRSRRDWAEHLGRRKYSAIISLGDAPLNFFCGRAALKDSRGTALALHKDFGLDDVRIHPTYDLGLIRRVPTYRRVVVSDMRSAVGQSKPPETVEWKYWSVGTSILYNPVKIAWDIEYAINGEIVDYPTMVSAATDTGENWVAIGEDNMRSLLNAIKDSGAELITWNGWSADVPVVRKWGIDMPYGTDGMVYAYLLDETAPRGLEAQAMQHLGVGGWKHGNWREFNPDSKEAAIYAARDARITLELADVLKTKLGSREDIADLIMLPARKALDRMSSRGIYVNTVATARERKSAEILSEQALVNLISIHGSDKFNPGSTKQVGEWIEAQGIPLPKTETGKPKTDDKTLEGLKTNPRLRDFVTALLDYRGARKTIGTYCDAYEKIAATGDGRVHPTYSLFQVTGRSSASKTNVQNLPRAYKDFLGAAPGKVWAEVDYCVAPNTRVCKTNLVWVPIDSIAPGDKLIGFDEQAGRRAKMRESTVLSVAKLKRPCYRITTDKGTVISSAEHNWVITGKGDRGEGCKNRWKRTDEIKPGFLMPHWFTPWTTESTFEAGYLAGFLDGEGYVNSLGRVGWGQNPGPIADRVKNLLKARGIQSLPHTQEKGVNPGYTCLKYNIAADKGIPLIGAIRSERLILNWSSKFSGKFTMVSRWRKPAVVVSVDYLGEQDVVAIKTDTRTYIAEGFQSHNCAIEFRLAAWVANESSILARFSANPDWDAHRYFAARFYGIPEESVTKEQRQIAKSANFGNIYMGTGFTLTQYALGQGIDIPLSVAERIVAEWHKTFPGFKSFYNRTAKELRQTSEVATATGFIRHYGSIMQMPVHLRYAALRECVNVQVQSLAAHLAFIAMAELDRLNLPLVNFVHDSFAFEFDSEEQVKESLPVIEDIMCRHPIEFLKEHFGVDITVPLRVEAKVAKG